MQFLYYKVDPNQILLGIQKLSLANRLLMKRNYSSIYNELEDNDDIFINPELFYHFYAITESKECLSIKDIISLENFYKNVKVGKEGVANYEVASFEDRSILFSDRLPKLLYNDTKLNHIESLSDTLSRWEPIIRHAWQLIVTHLSDLAKLITLSVKEVCMFSAVNQFSKASLSSFGTAFINTYEQPLSEVFLIEDMAHQCGHIAFYAITIPNSAYFRASPRKLVKDFTHVDWEARDLYGIFHGLFTYTTIIYSLDILIDKCLLAQDELEEAKARLIFYMDKFRKDLCIMDDNRILSPLGFEHLDMFMMGYVHIYDKYKLDIRSINLSSQTYIFNYGTFKSEN